MPEANSSTGSFPSTFTSLVRSPWAAAATTSRRPSTLRRSSAACFRSFSAICGCALLRRLLLLEERPHAVGEMSQGILAGDLKLLGVIALGDAAQDFEHAVDPGLHRFDRGVDDAGSFG